VIKQILEKKLSVSRLRKLRNLVRDIKAFGRGSDLNKLAEIYQTDKIGNHCYTPHYASHLKKFKYDRIKLLEIGVGGYENLHEGGNSLRMWKKYFPFGKIFSIDLFDKSSLQENRIKIFCGSQIDTNFLEKITNKIGEIDIIIDDGSHINEHVIETFKMLFPKLKNGGIYVVEDTQTSYWKDYGGDMDLSNSKTTMNFFKGLTDSLNYKEFKNTNHEHDYFGSKIRSIHFYHNLIFIYKGDNNNGSIF
jgi:hypothetical protein